MCVFVVGGQPLSNIFLLYLVFGCRSGNFKGAQQYRFYYCSASAPVRVRDVADYCLQRYQDDAKVPKNVVGTYYPKYQRRKDRNPESNCV